MFAGIFSCTPSFSPEINKVYLILSYLMPSTFVTRSTEMRNKSGHVKSGKSTSKSIGDGLH